MIMNWLFDKPNWNSNLFIKKEEKKNLLNDYGKIKTIQHSYRP
jgi:hypothetical protein